MPAQKSATFPHSVLRIRPLEDELVESLGHNLRSIYVETYWLPVLGPSATLLLRRLSLGLATHTNGYTINLASLSKELGLGTRGGKHSPLWRSIERICRFDAATRNEDILAVRRSLSTIQSRHRRKLPESLQTLHEKDYENLAPPNQNPRPVKFRAVQGPQSLPSR